MILRAAICLNSLALDLLLPEITDFAHFSTFNEKSFWWIQFTLIKVFTNETLVKNESDFAHACDILVLSYCYRAVLNLTRLGALFTTFICWVLGPRRLFSMSLTTSNYWSLRISYTTSVASIRHISTLTRVFRTAAIHPIWLKARKMILARFPTSIRFLAA